MNKHEFTDLPKNTRCRYVLCCDASLGSHWRRNCYHGAELQYRAQLVLSWISWRAFMSEPSEIPDTIACTASLATLQRRSPSTVLIRVIVHPRLPRALLILLLPILPNLLFPPFVLLFAPLLPGAALARGGKGWKPGFPERAARFLAFSRHTRAAEGAEHLLIAPSIDAVSQLGGPRLPTVAVKLYIEDS